jgi:phenylalanyl-tRNA synthetase beta subunit
MKVPLNWLRDYVDIDISAEELVKKLTAIGHMQDKKPEQIAGDTVLDLEVRQNRSDCLSIMGIAQEVAAVTNKTTKKLANKLIDKETRSDTLTIINEAPMNCLRFSAYKIAGINPGATTPDWMKVRLEAYGMKTISPVVDITNFVMIETGEPMHAFDSCSVPNGILKIRQAKKGESLTVLGDKKVSLTDDDLVIVDKNDMPISFSGLIGGATSGIKDESSEIIVEAATYNQAVIRRSSIRHSIRTEASTRHEKFLNPELVTPSLDRAIDLILQICGGQVTAYCDSYPTRSEQHSIVFEMSEVERIGGVKIEKEAVRAILRRLDFVINIHDNKTDNVVVPHHRTDIRENADIVEEVLRIYGYDNINGSLPDMAVPRDITPKHIYIYDKLRQLLLALGFSETITEPLTSEKYIDVRTAIALQNALNSEKSYLRTSLIPHLCHAYKHIKKHGKRKIMIFEIGKTYYKVNDKYEEVDCLALLIYDYQMDTAHIQEQLAGSLNQLRQGVFDTELPDGVKITHVDENTVVCELRIPDIKKTAISNTKLFFDHIPHYTKIDISFAMDDDADTSIIAKIIADNIHNLSNIDWHYETDHITQGKQHLLMSLTVEDDDTGKTPLRQKVENILKDQFGATIR